MKLFLFLLTTTSFFSPLHAQETTEILQHRTRMLYLRIHEIVKHRQYALKECFERTREPSVMEIHEGIGKVLLHKLSPLPEDVLWLMKLYQYTNRFNREPLCGAEISFQDALVWKTERKKFEHFTKMEPELANLLDPHCSSVMERDTQGKLDTNPCFAGDNLVSELLWKNPDFSPAVVEKGLQEILQNLHLRLSTSPNGNFIDWWDLFWLPNIDRTNLNVRKLFLAMLTFLKMSCTSNCGTVDGYGDFVWKNTLDNGEEPAKALERYSSLKQIVDSFRDLMNWADKKYIQFWFSGKYDVTGANRHNFMASFLSCYLRSTKNELIAKGIPIALGYIYEGMDFKSHLDEGNSVWRSIESFFEDTARYHDGVKWGYDFCAE